MRVAALYDVLGNLPALEAVLADERLADVDVVVSGGDVAAGPFPRECLDRLRRLGDRVLHVRGNADRMLDGWPAARLDEVERARLREWPTTLELEVDGLGRVVFCHGSPRSDEEILTAITPEQLVREACGDGGVVVAGHTHVQFDRVVGETRLVNAGSVGCPYEGRRGAFWALLGPDVRLVSTAYDVDRAVEAVRSTGYENADDLVSWLLEPVAPEEATAHFESRRGA
jgi:putative phosphoesterase